VIISQVAEIVARYKKLTILLLVIAILVLWNAVSGGDDEDNSQTTTPGLTPTASATAAKASPTAKASKTSAKPKPRPTPTKISSKPTVMVGEVIDGDTVAVSGGKRVRLIGIDAPETGECGGADATKIMQSLVLDKRVVLVKGAATDQDRYGRLLRYVDVKGTGMDAGLELLMRGLAIPRYDSMDGYGEHPREERYYRQAEPPIPCRAEEEQPAPADEDEPWNRPGPPDLDCSDIGHPVQVDPPDYHRLDRDGDWGGL
jgi:endonuclease YncB( thermonuclease family)